MSTLTVDVGLKNLALCIMSKNQDSGDYSIKLWDVYNTLESDGEAAVCNASTKKGTLCGKKCGYKFVDSSSGVVHFTCKPHFPKGIVVSQKNKVKIKRVNEYLLQDITKIILLKIKNIYENNASAFEEVNKILIELQPKVNNKMKLISHLIYGKFVELYLDTDVPIRFVKASQKLKVYKGPTIECKLKDAYSRRKRLSIEYTKWFLNGGDEKCKIDSANEWSTKFQNHSKKDDLGDVFLMALNDLKITKKSKL